MWVGLAHRAAARPTQAAVTLEVNGVTHSIAADSTVTLVDVLRGELGLTGTKVGCARGECGACTVLVADRPVTSCLVLAATVTEPVTTVEGIADAAADLRAAFADYGGFQCGFCTPGQLVSAEAYLRSLTGVADEDEVRRALAGNICRCTGYSPIVDAVLATARARQEAQ
jgi:aerobic-type carbon monoxide dehydrogenase small subunit (CoxS/CutS family)